MSSRNEDRHDRVPGHEDCPACLQDPLDEHAVAAVLENLRILGDPDSGASTPPAVGSILLAAQTALLANQRKARRRVLVRGLAAAAAALPFVAAYHSFLTGVLSDTLGWLVSQQVASLATLAHTAILFLLAGITFASVPILVEITAPGHGQAGASGRGGGFSRYANEPLHSGEL